MGVAARRSMLTMGAMPPGQMGAPDFTGLSTSFGNISLLILSGGVAPASATTTMKNFKLYLSSVTAYTNGQFFACTLSGTTATVTALGPTFSISTYPTAVDISGSMAVQSGHLLGVWYNNAWFNPYSKSATSETSYFHDVPQTQPSVGLNYTSLQSAVAWRTGLRASNP